MKFLTILFISISVACLGQTKEITKANGLSKDTLSTPANAIQLERLNAIQEKINANQKEFADLLELIFGVKIEEVEWWGFKGGKFLFTLKPKATSLTLGGNAKKTN